MTLPEVVCLELTEPAQNEALRLGREAWLLRGFARAAAPAFVAEIEGILAAAPFRHMVTPGGSKMSVALTNCGSLGWTSDRGGYRYAAHDPVTGRPWPPMPRSLAALAREAAACAGFAGFAPDACLINRYLPGARLSLHQDRDEREFDAPIVSVSLGLPATFLFGGLARGERPARVRLAHGDVVVWGGVDRLRYHGVAPLRVPRSAGMDLFASELPEMLRGQRINLTLRKAG
jgi:alkylated DNA repair protein (DNA oxidative demethylase)